MGRRLRLGKGKSPSSTTSSTGTSTSTSCSSYGWIKVLIGLVGAVVSISQLILLEGNKAAVSTSSSAIIDTTSATATQEKLPSPVLPSSVAMKPTKGIPRVLAIVFPQYHQDPLNDRLWGPGFTDWDNLRAAPLRNRLGFEIPRPLHSHYYDLTNATVRKWQGQIARQCGVDGFVFHHYWFYDKEEEQQPVLSAPLLAMLQDGQPDIPFFLNWCDSSWVDTWLGVTKKHTNNKQGDTVLQTQYFPDENNDDDAIVAHYQWLRQFFHHPNYIKVAGQPVFMIHQRKPSSYPILKRLRDLAVADGFPSLYFIMGMSFTHAQLFPSGLSQGQRRDRYPKYLVNKTVAYPYPLDWMERQVLQVPQWCSIDNEQRIDTELPGILTSFDNTPRRDLESAHLWSADEPDRVVQRFSQSLTAAIYYQTCCCLHDNDDNDNSDNDSFVLINSMNEWAEGMSLEPSTVFGWRLLEAVQRAKADVIQGGCNARTT
ncbi:glycosyltransferase [Seminavis robusta]|uniref:Glycosyltransferase n=1 Tax=Seminavis robusta TaxID=568900 RepID=A0A9N8EMT4_9STRA|nr:glycosyltransferase [Seminavis robusta]|eukprot:Sro1568_g283040.1 glycosyltransferase (EC 2.4.1.-) (484) ;mRNA; f:7265-8716